MAEFVQALRTAVSGFSRDESGQDMVEYALLMAFIALAVVGLLTGIKTQVKGIWSTVSSTLSSTNTAAS